MSLLPQRKKSPEEIAKLREDLGIHAATPEVKPAPPTAPPAALPPQRAPEPHQPSPASPAARPTQPSPTPVEAPAPHPPKQVHSLKRSERIPLLTPEGPQPALRRDDDPPLITLTLKPVRSLKKSEQIPLPATYAPPPPDTNLPYHRHSNQELQEIRRRDALTKQNPTVNPNLVVAHTALLFFGYLTALAGALPYAVMLYQYWFSQNTETVRTSASSLFAFAPLPITIPGCCVATAIFIAGFIALKKPISRHHAAFIAAITLFVVVFDILHYFPHLRHGT